MFGVLVECMQELSRGFLFCTKQGAEMQDNHQLAGELSDEESNRPSPVEVERFHGGTMNTSVPTGGARPKVFSSYMRMTKSKSSHQSSESSGQTSNEGTAFESNCSPLTTSASFFSAHHPFSRDVNTASSTNLLQAAEYPCDEREPMERWKNAGIALRKALSSSTSCTLAAPITNCMSHSFHMSNQGAPSNSRSKRKSSRHHITRKNILDSDSLGISDASAILSNLPVTSSPLLCKKHGSFISESPLTGDVDIAPTNQLELRDDYEIATLPLSSSSQRLKRVDSFSKSENEIDVPEKCVLERSPGMFNLCSDEHDLRTFDSKTSHELYNSQTDLCFGQHHHRGLVMNLDRTLENVGSKVSNCTHGDNPDSSQSQTYKMLECRLNSLISSDDKSFVGYSSSSDSDITDCSSLYEDDDGCRPEIKVLAAGTARDEREPKKQKRKSQNAKKYRNGETACSSDSIQEGAKICQRQKKKLKETLENSPQNGCLYMLDTPLPHNDWSHSSITDSDSETHATSFHRRSRIRSGRTSREKKAAAIDVDKMSKDFRWVSPLPRRHNGQASKHSTTKGPHDWTSTDSLSDSLLRGQRHLGTYSSSSSLDKVTGCDLDRTVPPLTWSIVDGLQTESDSYHRGQMSRGLLHNLHPNHQDQLVDYNQTHTWSLLDSLYSQSNENLSNLLSANPGRHDDQQKQDDSDPSCVAYDDVCCSCSGNKGANTCRRSESSHNGYHYKECQNIDEFTWNKLDTQLAWDMWDLPPSESTLIDIPAAVGCQSESETHSGLDGDTDSADADDEFECDCIHCQQMRDVFSHRPNSQGNEPETAAAAAAAAATAIAASSSPLPLPTSTASVLLNTGSSGSLSSDHNDWSTSLSEDNPLDINIAELNPLDLLLMRQDARRDMLELMFQNVILQMLAVHPDLLNDQAPPPATQTAIENLHSIHVTQEDVEQDASCPICLCSWELNETMAQLPCQHMFHPLCIRAWLIKSGTCPVCRHVL